MKNESIQTVTDLINNEMIYFYEMKECNTKFNKGQRTEKEIKCILQSLTPSQIKEVLNGLTVSMEFVNRYFESYFTDLPTEEVKPKSKLSTIMSNAWYYFKKQMFVSFAECLRYAWKAYNVTRSLLSGQVSFMYRKATGELRNAVGTLNNHLFEYNAKGVRKESKPDTIKYFDLGVNAWRMFRIERLISIAA